MIRPSHHCGDRGRSSRSPFGISGVRRSERASRRDAGAAPAGRAADRSRGRRPGPRAATAPVAAPAPGAAQPIRSRIAPTRARRATPTPIASRRSGTTSTIPRTATSAPRASPTTRSRRCSARRRTTGTRRRRRRTATGCGWRRLRQGDARLGYLDRAWKNMERYIIPTRPTSPRTWRTRDRKPATYAPEGDTPADYPSQLTGSVPVGRDPIATELQSTYGRGAPVYGMHWIIDVDNWYGFGQRGDGTTRAVATSTPSSAARRNRSGRRSRSRAGTNSSSAASTATSICS